MAEDIFAGRDLLSTILSAVLGSGGLVGMIALWRTWKAKRAGAPGGEVAAKLSVTPDREGLNDYWKAELAAVRAERDREIKRIAASYEAYRKQAEETIRNQSSRIDRLETHIWLHGEPPPPA